MNQSIMSAEQPQNQRRQSHRFVVGDAVQGELVLADRSRWPVRLFDQSAGGFSVLTNGPIPVSPGDMLQLQTDSFCSEVRVVHAAEIEPDDGNGDASTPRFRLGLMRLGDLVKPPDEKEQAGAWLPWYVSRPNNHRSQIALFLCLLAIPVIAIIVIGGLHSLRPWRSPSAFSTTDGGYAAGESPGKRNASPGAGGNRG